MYVLLLVLEHWNCLALNLNTVTEDKLVPVVFGRTLPKQSHEHCLSLFPAKSVERIEEEILGTPLPAFSSFETRALAEEHEEELCVRTH